MGYVVELNTLLGVPEGFNTSTLKQGKKYTVLKDRERAFPLHIALLLVDHKWNFYGYCVANSAIVKEGKTEIEFAVLTLFSEAERALYKKNFINAAKQTGEIK